MLIMFYMILSLYVPIGVFVGIVAEDFDTGLIWPFVLLAKIVKAIRGLEWH